MQSTPIKINTSPNGQSEPAKLTKKAVSLNGLPTKAGKNGLKKYLWLLLALVIFEGAAIGWLYLTKPISPYFKVLPRDPAISSYFSQSSLLDLLKTRSNWPPFSWGAGALQDLFKKTQIERPEQLLKLFEDHVALAILPQEMEQETIWLIIASVKAPDEVFFQAQNQAEQSLEQNYSLTNESYRQVKISRIKPLEQGKISLFYSQIKKYFILTNSEDLIKTTVDKIIK